MKVKKVRFITGHDSLDVNNYYLDLTPNSKGLLGGLQFTFNEDTLDHDYIVVFERLHKEIVASIPLDRIIFVAGEASSIKQYNNEFLNQFGHVITCQERVKHISKHLKSPGHSWFSKKTYDELLNTTTIEKTKLLSIVVSNKISTKGHRDRLEFCLRLKDHFGEQIDIFGRGFNEFHDKWDVIAPYKYSVAIENTVEDHWVTEKIGDCYTAHTFPFYIGAPNIDDYYNPKSYELLDIDDVEKSVGIITNIINDPNHYANHLGFLEESKIDYINKHNIIPMVCDFINLKTNNPQICEMNKAIQFKIYPEKIGLITKVKSKISNYFS